MAICKKSLASPEPSRSEQEVWGNIVFWSVFQETNSKKTYFITIPNFSFTLRVNYLQHTDLKKQNPNLPLQVPDCPTALVFSQTPGSKVQVRSSHSELSWTGPQELKVPLIPVLALIPGSGRVPAPVLISGHSATDWCKLTFCPDSCRQHGNWFEK